MPRHDAPRDLLFGLLALQNGMVNQAQLVAAFGAWTASPGRAMPDLLVAQGALSPPRRALLDALLAEHLAVHGGDPEKSLAALEVNCSTRESLALAGGPAVEATLAHAGSGSEVAADRTVTYAVGSAPAEGQRFRVLRPHAQGGLGAVFVALDEELHREVALKQILDGHADDPSSRQRFLLEAELTGRLEHPGVVPVYGLGTTRDGRPYYAMRFVRGETLKEAVEAFHRADASGALTHGERSVTLRKLLARFLGVCHAIDYAHSRGVVHRDLKPANVLLGPYGETLVVDWGLAKVVGRDEASAEATLRPASASGPGASSQTQAGSALGTPAYMSPEQADGRLEAIGPASDVYSLGATLYFLLTGKPAVEDRDVATVLRRVQRGDFPPPRAVHPRVAKSLEAIVLKAMAHEPSRRYPSARALAEDLEHWLADEPVSAYREPWTTSLIRWLTRHRVAVTSAAAAALVALVGLTGVAAVQRSANQSLAAANVRLDAALGRESKANRELTVANAETQRQRDRARANFDQARRAVNDYLTQVSQDVLLKEPGMKPLRKRLLESALGYYEEFAQQETDDPAIRATVAEALERVATITGEIGTVEAAQERWGQAWAVWEALARSHPDEARYTVGRARVLRNRKDLPAALALLEPLAARRPDDVEVLDELATIYGQLAREQAGIAAGQTTAVERELREKSLAIRERLARGHPEDLRAQANLASVALLVGFYHARKGEDDLAIASVMRARDLYQRIAREQPAGFGLEVWTELARANLNLAFAHQTAGRYEPSLSFFREFLDIYGRLARENPGVADYASAILSGNAMLAYSLAGLDRFDEAVAVYEEVTASADRLQRDHPDRFDPRTGLAVLGASNNHAETLRRAVRLPEALAAADRGLRRFEVLPFGMLGPLALNYRADVALLRSTRGQILGDLGRREEAINALTESAAGFQALTTEEDYPPARRRFAETLLQLASQQATLGELAGAAESVRRAEEALPAETRASDFHASLHAVKAALAGPDREEANRQGDLAIAALRRIVAERSLPVSSLRFEPTFEAIRDRPDLQALLLDRAFPTEPFARER